MADADSISALHVAIAAGVVGFLVFSISHAWSAWGARNKSQRTSLHRHAGKLFWLAVACLVGAWLDQELTRREGVILGAELFVVRGRTLSNPEVTEDQTVERGDVLAAMRSPALEQERAALDHEAEVARSDRLIIELSPLVLAPDLIRVQQQAVEDERIRLQQLGFSGDAETGEVALSAYRARARVAQQRLVRARALTTKGLASPSELDDATSAADVARAELKQHTILLEAARRASTVRADAETRLRADVPRATAAREAQLAGQSAKLAGLERRRALLDTQLTVRAPFSGTVVYRHPAPSLAEEGQVILALAKGAGFMARIEIPRSDVELLTPGQSLPLQLKNALVTDRLIGTYTGRTLPSSDPARTEILIECSLPIEQFSALTTDSVRVSLRWRPSFARSPVALAGMVSLLLSVGLMLAGNYLRRRTVDATPKPVPAEQTPWSPGWSLTADEEQVFNVGLRFGGELANGSLRDDTVALVELMIERQPMVAPLVLRDGVLDGLRGASQGPTRIKPSLDARHQRLLETLNIDMRAVEVLDVA